MVCLPGRIISRYWCSLPRTYPNGITHSRIRIVIRWVVTSSTMTTVIRARYAVKIPRLRVRRLLGIVDLYLSFDTPKGADRVCLPDRPPLVGARVGYSAGAG